LVPEGCLQRREGRDGPGEKLGRPPRYLTTWHRSVDRMMSIRGAGSDSPPATVVAAGKNGSGYRSSSARMQPLARWRASAVSVVARSAPAGAASPEARASDQRLLGLCFVHTCGED
jgi:hypothetical protein